MLLLALRQALIMMLGAMEDYLAMERSIVPKHRRTHQQSENWDTDLLATARKAVTAVHAGHRPPGALVLPAPPGFTLGMSEPGGVRGER